MKSYLSALVVFTCLTSCTLGMDTTNNSTDHGARGYKKLYTAAVIAENDRQRHAILTHVPGTRVIPYTYSSSEIFLDEFGIKHFDIVICDHSTQGEYVLAEVRRRASSRILFILVSAWSSSTADFPEVQDADHIINKNNLSAIAEPIREFVCQHKSCN